MRASHAATSTARGRARTRVWADLPEAELLQVRVKDLGLKLEGTWLEDCVDSLNTELDRRGLKVQAHAWISDEWFSPDNTPGIAVPFYLAHPRLAALERRMLLGVEGGTRRECMQILRHEAGHVLQHTYGLHRRRRWQQLFGRSSTRYPDSYRPNPASKDFVQHLPRWYAQSHPDEDFAETFALWLTPRSNWRKRYAEWPALRKLEYVEELMAEIVDAPQMLTKRVEVDPVSTMSITLGEHYQKKLDHSSLELSSTYDRDLQRIFSAEPADRKAPPASAFVRRNRAAIRQSVSRRTGEYQIAVDTVISEIIDRCRVLSLRAPGSETRLRSNVTSMLAARTVRSRYRPSRRQWFTL